MNMRQFFETASAQSRLAWLCPDPDRYHWSPGIYDLLGLPVGSVGASPDLFMRFVHPQDQHVRHAIEGNEPAGIGEIFFRVVSRDGTIKLVSLVGLEAAGDDRPGLLCLFDYASHLDPRADRAIPAGSHPLPGHHPYALWSLYDESADFTLSGSARRILGLAPAERLNLPQLLRQIPAEERGPLAEAFALGESARLACSVSCGDGATRRLEFTFFAADAPRDQHLGRWGAVEDVTERWERDNRLEQAEQLLSDCLEGITDGILIMDRDGRVASLNDEARRLLEGVTRGSVIWDAIPALAADPIWRDVRGVVETGRATTDERFVPPFGHWVRYTIRRAAGGALLVVLRDRDEIYELRSRFHELTSRCDAAFDLGRIGLWDYDPQSDTIWFAQSAKALIGSRTLTLAEFLARVAPEDVDRIRDLRDRALTDGAPFDIAFGFTGGDGALRQLRSRGGLRRGGLESGRRLAGILAEISEGGGPDAGAVMLPEARDPGPQALTGIQVRAARGALRWSVRELAENSSVSVATINRFEADARPVITRDSSVAALYDVLRERGVAFFADGEGRPAISVDETGTA